MMAGLRQVSVDHPLVLALLVLALLPFAGSPFACQPIPALVLAPKDTLSHIVRLVLQMAGAFAIAGLVLGLSGLHRREQVIEREGTGAHVVLLLDRSSSMDNSFADRAPTGDQESKSAAAKRLLSDFIARRPNDRIGVAAFSTSPMPVLPLTDHHGAVKAAIAAIDRSGLASTDVGRGLALALSYFDGDTNEASRAVVLVSDGAAVIDRKVQDALRNAATRTPVHLYWLFLRTKGTRGIFDIPPPGEDTPQANPERHLDLFLQSLGLPYRAFEAGSPQAVQQAIAEIDRQETRPMRYAERVPRQELSRWAYGLAGVALALLILAKLAERRFGVRVRARSVTPGVPSDRRMAA